MDRHPHVLLEFEEELRVDGKLCRVCSTGGGHTSSGGNVKIRKPFYGTVSSRDKVEFVFQLDCAHLCIDRHGHARTRMSFSSLRRYRTSGTHIMRRTEERRCEMARYVMKCVYERECTSFSNY